MGGEIIGVLWAIPGSLVLAFLLLCVVANAARPYTIPTLVFSVVGSAIAAACRNAPSQGTVAFYSNVFLGTFFFVGTVLRLFALSIRWLRESRP